MLKRIADIEIDLASWAQKTPSFEFDASATNLFSTMELLFSFAKRGHDLAAATRAMLSLNRIPPAVILARALIETTAMGCYYVHEMRRLIANGKLDNLNAKLERFYAGTRKGEVASIHVNDALRHLEGLDTAYFKRLAGKYDALAESVQAASVDIENPLFVEKSYALLSEVAHPSGSGTQYLYPAPGGPDIGAVEERLRFSCEVSIWQTHHLLRAMAQGVEIPELYKATFMK